MRTATHPHARYTRVNLPSTPVKQFERTYSSLEVEKISGATLRQLQWWDEHGVVRPHQDGHRRYYSFTQAVFCSIVAELRPLFSLQRLRKLFVAIKSDQAMSRNSARPKVYLLISDHQAMFAFSEVDVVEKMAFHHNRRFALIAVHDIINRLGTL